MVTTTAAASPRGDVYQETRTPISDIVVYQIENLALSPISDIKPDRSIDSQAQFLGSLTERLPDYVLSRIESSFNTNLPIDTRKTAIQGVLNYFHNQGPKISFLTALTTEAKIASYAQEQINRRTRPINKELKS